MKIRSLSKNRQIKSRRGATLLELTMVVGIIAIISIAAIAYYNSVNNGNKIKDEVNNLNSLSAAIRNMFNTQGSYEGLSNAVVLKSSTFPDRMRVPNNNTQIKHSWLSNGVTVASATVSGTAHDGFTITYKDVPNDACTDIVSNTYRHFVKVEAGNGAISNLGDVAGSCNSGSDKNTIIFTTR
ncbi:MULTISPECIES: type 4 pilus major pilin [Vibrio]|nr:MULTISPECIES: type 4 pilus major pilin [Vibrio]MDG3024885.1 type 4 pilus major pilin [Vibrio parahaemolyticus]